MIDYRSAVGIGLSAVLATGVLGAIALAIARAREDRRFRWDKRYRRQRPPWWAKR